MILLFSEKMSEEFINYPIKMGIMYLHLDKKRADYFADATATDVLRRFVLNKNPITVADIRALNERGAVISGTTEGDLDTILEKGDYHTNSLALVNKIDALTADQLLVLPSEYRIPFADVRQRVVYDLDTLVNLDGIGVKRAILGSDAKSGRMSQKQKREAQWSPEKVIKTAFDQLHEQKDELAEKVFTSYSWFGKDGHRRVVSLYRAVQGAELRAFQDFAAYRLLIPTMAKELRLGKSAQSSYSEPLTEEERKKRQAKIAQYSRYLSRQRPEGRSLRSYTNQMDVSFTDLIEQESRAFAHRGGRLMRVPSRSRPGQIYQVKLSGIPFLPPGSDVAYSQVWEMSGNCVCEDKLFRSDRRKTAVDRGSDEEFFCPHEIAALHSLRKKNEKNKPETIDFLPFVLPTAEMMNYVDRLREQTIMIEHNDPETKRTSKRSLNHTEIERLLWARVMARGYDACFTTDIAKFAKERYDPHLDLIKFRT